MGDNFTNQELEDYINRLNHKKRVNVKIELILIEYQMKKIFF